MSVADTAWFSVVIMILISVELKMYYIFATQRYGLAIDSSYLEAGVPAVRVEYTGYSRHGQGAPI